MTNPDERTPGRAFRGPRLKTLDLYVGRRFGGIFAANLAVFCVLYTLVDCLSQIDSFLEHSSGPISFFAVAFNYYYYELPGLFCRVLGPLTTVASAMFAVTVTQHANELVPVLGTGTSIQRMFAPILVASVVICGLSFAVQEIWIPGHRDEILAAQATGRNKDTVRHAVYRDTREGIVAVARRFHPFTRSAEGFLVFSTYRTGRENFLINSRSAQWDDSTGWILHDVELQQYDTEGRLVLQRLADEDGGRNGGDRSITRLTKFYARVALRDLLRERVPADLALELSPSEFEGEGSRAMYSKLGEIARKIESAPDRHRWSVRYYARLVDPLNHLVLVLIGIPTILRQGSRNVFLSSLVAVAISAGYFIMHSICLYFGNENYLSPAIAVWLSPILFGALGVTLYRGMRT